MHHSARKHGLTDTTIEHAIVNSLVTVDLDPDSDPPRVLAIGPDHGGNLLEVIWLEFADGVDVVIHAMPLRPVFRDLLPKPGGEAI